MYVCARVLTSLYLCTSECLSECELSVLPVRPLPTSRGHFMPRCISWLAKLFDYVSAIMGLSASRSVTQAASLMAEGIR